MKKRIFMIHGWGGCPDAGWMLWLKKELEKKEFNFGGLTSEGSDFLFDISF